MSARNTRRATLPAAICDSSSPTPNYVLVHSPFNRVQQQAAVHQEAETQTNNEPKVNNATKKEQEMVNMVPPSSTNDGGGALIHICHWQGDCHVHFPSAPPQQSLNAPASSLYENQQHRH